MAAESAGSGVSRAQFAQLESGRTEPIPLGLRKVLQTGCWLRKWHLPREENQFPKGYILYDSLQIAY